MDVTAGVQDPLVFSCMEVGQNALHALEEGLEALDAPRANQREHVTPTHLKSSGIKWNFNA